MNDADEHKWAVWVVAAALIIIFLLGLCAVANDALTPCQQFCIQNWLRGNGADNHQGCNVVGWAVAASPNAWCKMMDANSVAEKWLME